MNANAERVTRQTIANAWGHVMTLAGIPDDFFIVRADDGASDYNQHAYLLTHHGGHSAWLTRETEDKQSPFELGAPVVEIDGEYTVKGI